jgi:hypothetical protein
MLPACRAGDQKKENQAMCYSKPEVAVLGDATSVILGVKHESQEPGQPTFVKNIFMPDSELDS